MSFAAFDCRVKAQRASAQMAADLFGQEKHVEVESKQEPLAAEFEGRDARKSKPSRSLSKLYYGHQRKQQVDTRPVLFPDSNVIKVQTSSSLPPFSICSVLCSSSDGSVSGEEDDKESVFTCDSEPCGLRKSHSDLSFATSQTFRSPESVRQVPVESDVALDENDAISKLGQVLWTLAGYRSPNRGLPPRNHHAWALFEYDQIVDEPGSEAPSFASGVKMPVLEEEEFCKRYPKSNIDLSDSLAYCVRKINNNLLKEQLEEKGLSFGLRLLLCGLVLMDRVFERTRVFRLTQINVRRVVITCAMLVSKFGEDQPLQNKFWARISGISLDEINKCEVCILKMLDFNVRVSPGEYTRTATSLGFF